MDLIAQSRKARADLLRLYRRLRPDKAARTMLEKLRGKA
jgi:hypothetical protein